MKLIIYFSYAESTTLHNDAWQNEQVTDKYKFTV